MVSLMPIMVLTKQFSIYWVSRDFVEYWRTSIDSLSVFFSEFEKQYQEVEKHETILRLDLKDFFSTRRKLNLRYWARTAAKLEFDEIKQQLQKAFGEAIFNSKDGAVSLKAEGTLYTSNGAYVTHCAIWYHLYNLKNVKNTFGLLLILVKLQASACNITKINTPPWMFFTFFKLYKWYQIAQHITYIRKQVFHKYHKKNYRRESKRYPEEVSNSVDNDGNVMRSHICGSIKHFVVS